MDLVFDQNGSATYHHATLMSLLSPAAQPSLQQPAPDQAIWPSELKRSKLTDIHTSTLSRSSWGPQAAWISRQEVHQQPPGRCRQLFHSPSETLGQLSRASVAVPSPNNNSQPQPRDSTLLSCAPPHTPNIPFRFFRPCLLSLAVLV